MVVQVVAEELDLGDGRRGDGGGEMAWEEDWKEGERERVSEKRAREAL